MSITVEDLRKRRDTLESEIAMRLRDFSGATGVVVTDVRVSVLDASSIGDSRRQVLYRTRVTVELDAEP